LKKEKRKNSKNRNFEKTKNSDKKKNKNVTRIFYHFEKEKKNFWKK